MLQSLLLLAGLVASGLTTPLSKRKEYAVKDSHYVPIGWRKAAKAPADHVMNLQIGLKQSRFEELERQLYEGMSTCNESLDPSHEKYGKHLSAAAVADLIRPSDETIDAVHEWLADHAIDPLDLDYSPSKDWIKISLPVSSVERLLDTDFYHYVHDDGDMLVRAPEWSLPEYLHKHVDTIQPTNSFFRPTANSKVRFTGDTIKLEDVAQIYNKSGIAEVCNTALVTPQCLRTLYGTVDYKVQSAGKNYMALNDFLGEINLRSDAEIYLEMFRPEAESGAYQFSQISVAGGTLQQTPENETQLEDGTGIEGNLDVQTMLGIAWPTPLTAFSTGGLNPDFIPDLFTPTDSDEPYLVWLEYMLSLPDGALPTVISTSYGDDEETISYSYANSACNMMAQLGARGVSILFASGDYGVGGTGTCYKNDGSNSSTFLPGFPATCPFVTAVGATQGFTPEVAAYDGRFETPFTSGGGFSNYFPRPAYQDAVVPNYLTAYVGTNYSGLYNATGRGYPDVAAQGVNYSTVWNASVTPVDGTSAATPAMSAVIALVNDALIAAGKSPLGFLNPWLYAGGYKGFHDILSGSSAGCGTDGFPAEKGWDAVTGFGTPYFPSILHVLGVNATS